MSEFTQDELSTLKARADLMGIPYHPSIGLDKLREKLNASLSDKPKEPGKSESIAAATPAAETEAQMLQRMRDEQLALIRIRLTCMNPNKAEWQGELFTVGNSLVGPLTKFVPFSADDGWHVPRILYEFLLDRQCQVFVTGKTKNGVSIRQGKLIKEFAIEVLPPLTKTELHELAQRQAMADGE